MKEIIQKGNKKDKPMICKGIQTSDKSGEEAKVSSTKANNPTQPHLPFIES